MRHSVWRGEMNLGLMPGRDSALHPRRQRLDGISIYPVASGVRRRSVSDRWRASEPALDSAGPEMGLLGHELLG
ncbi:MAG TPA: hypothetical protein VFJ52_02415, partial [Terriglobia bacterium]|nr:hypothetical protein [Terriglobia bacterium]